MSADESYLLTCERDAQDDARNHQDDGYSRLVAGMRRDYSEIPDSSEL